MCGLPAIIGKETVIIFSQEHTREQDVQEHKLHVVYLVFVSFWSGIQNLFKQEARNKSQKRRYWM